MGGCGSTFHTVRRSSMTGSVDSLASARLLPEGKWLWVALVRGAPGRRPDLRPRRSRGRAPRGATVDCEMTLARTAAVTRGRAYLSPLRGRRYPNRRRLD